MQTSALAICAHFFCHSASTSGLGEAITSLCGPVSRKSSTSSRRAHGEALPGEADSQKNVELAGDDKRVAAPLPADEAGGVKTAEHQVVFLENFLDELWRKLPVGK